jgi:periplasmic glucans biosynthesis protein
LRRRDVLGLLAALAFPAPAVAKLRLAPSADFDPDSLVSRARELAENPYIPIAVPAPEVLEEIGYDQHGALRFRPEQALWADDPQRRYAATFFHLGRYFKTPVQLFAVEDGKAAEILYDESLFEMPAASPAHRLPAGSGFAGFRFQETKDGALDWLRNDWVAFLGASYFRAIGDDFQYGLSARGLMLDAAVAGKREEFPLWRAIYLEQPPGGDQVLLHALLDGPSVAGAYRFAITRGKAVTMEIAASLFIRQPVERLGLAPLTSMYWFSETRKPGPVDWRPEVHDSDGLMLLTGQGEQLWRPLNNPASTVVSAFADENPKGFGLMQRDRAFDHYLDGVRYHRRPSLWVEPLGNWGKGSVTLIEIPTDDEIHDNIVVAWVPGKPPVAGQQIDLAYRLHWQSAAPTETGLAQCIATRIGNGGEPGTVRPKGVRRFVVEFKGEALAKLPFGVLPEVIVSASRGAISRQRAEAVPNDVPGHWRAQFDLAVDGTAPVEMRCHLRLGNTALSETWAFQFHPF